MSIFCLFFIDSQVSKAGAMCVGGGERERIFCFSDWTVFIIEPSNEI